jgi:NTE family protein
MGVSEREKSKWERKFLGKKSQPQVHDLERSFFSLFQDQRVKNVFPMLTYNPTTEKNTLVLKVKKNPEIRVEAGGVFSSRSINTGYLGLEYYPFSQRNFKLVGRSYFGRFYGSAMGEIHWGTSSFKRPMVLKLSYIQNRWDYYKSISTFFEDIKPSFVVLNEQVFKLGSVIATGQHHVLQCESMYSHQYDKYYQTNQFLSVDTADQTRFDAWISRIKWQYNDLNRKQYASEGMMLDFAYKYVKGFEQTIPGSTNLLRDTTHQWHDWSVFSIKLIAYQRVSDFLSFGIRFQDLWSSQGAFNNYMASIINSPVFQPTPESATYFLPTFRATHYAAIGGMGVIGITDKLDARLESHWFFSGMQYTDNPDHSTGVNRTITRSVIQSGALVYHSPVGPVSLQVNYYERKAVPWGVAFHFGYILFNDSPRD